MAAQQRSERMQNTVSQWLRLICYYLLSSSSSLCVWFGVVWCRVEMRARSHTHQSSSFQSLRMKRLRQQHHHQRQRKRSHDINVMIFTKIYCNHVGCHCCCRCCCNCGWNVNAFDIQISIIFIRPNDTCGLVEHHHHHMGWNECELSTHQMERGECKMVCHFDICLNRLCIHPKRLSSLLFTIKLIVVIVFVLLCVLLWDWHVEWPMRIVSTEWHF